jgi:hypothetical protein
LFVFYFYKFEYSSDIPAGAGQRLGFSGLTIIPSHFDRNRFPTPAFQ